MRWIARAAVYGFGMLVFLGIAVACFRWGSIVRLGADDTDGKFALWVYDDDAASGGSIDASIRVDAGERVRIDGVVVDGAGKRQRFSGAGASWGDTLHTGGVPERATATVDFTIAIPEIDADRIHLAIRVRATAAMAMFTTFSNDTLEATFERDVELHRSQTLRRAIRIAVALGAALTVVALLVAARRRFARRNATPHAAWTLLLVPHAVVGYLAFAHQLSLALGFHSLWFVAVAMLAWWLVLAIPSRVTGPLGLQRYHVAPALLATEATGDAYRSAHVPERLVSLADLEGAWMSAGLVVRRKRSWLEVGAIGARPARVRIPSGELFSGPFEIHAPDRITLERMVVAASRLFGELRVD